MDQKIKFNKQYFLELVVSRNFERSTQKGLALFIVLLDDQIDTIIEGLVFSYCTFSVHIKYKIFCFVYEALKIRGLNQTAVDKLHLFAKKYFYLALDEALLSKFWYSEFKILEKYFIKDKIF